MFDKKPIKSRSVPPKKNGGGEGNPTPKLISNIYLCIGVTLVILSVILAVIAFNYASKSKKYYQIAGVLNKKVKDLEKPKFDEKYDFLTNQCDNTAFCVSTATNNPSLEIYKFLVNFHEQSDQKYRLFFEVSVGKTKVAQPFKYSCDTQDSEFYICQEITATSPTDVMRVFATSYKTLTKNATYSFDLMVKPIGEIQDISSVKMKPNPNLVVTMTDEKPMEQAASEPMSQPESQPTEEPINGGSVLGQNAPQPDTQIGTKANNSLVN